MIIFKVVLPALSGLFIANLMVIFYNLVKFRLQVRRINAKVPKWVHVLDTSIGGLFGNHINFVLGPRCLQRLNEKHREHSPYLGCVIQDKLTVSTTDLDLIKIACIDKANTNINRVALKFPMNECESNCIFTCENEQWRNIRRNFAPALKPARFKSPNVILEIETTINKALKAIEKQITRHGDHSMIDTEELIRRYSNALVLSCLYKQPDRVNFDLDQRCEWTHMVDQGFSEMQKNRFFFMSVCMPEFRHIVDWVGYNFSPIGKWRRSLMEFIKRQSKIGLEARRQIEEARKSGKKIADEDNFRLKDGTQFRRNMVDYIVDKFLEGKLTKDEFFNSSWFLYGAADKTASDSLVYTLYQLGVNQDIQHKLRESIKVDGLDSEYLTWVINESLRLNPAVPLTASRTLCERIVYRPKAYETGFYKDEPPLIMEAGSILVTAAFSIHRLEKYWGPDASEFKPERWLDADKHHPAQFIPFGLGPRSCPGREFALFEMRLLVAALVTNYQMECNVKGDILEFDSPLFIFNMQQTPLMMRFTKLAVPKNRSDITDSLISKTDAAAH